MKTNNHYGWTPLIVTLAVFLGASVWQGFAIHASIKERGTHINGAWDPNFYFMWGRSMAVDGDVDFENDFTYLISALQQGPERESFENYLATFPRTENGSVRNKYAIGLGVLSFPALSLAGVVNNAAGISDPTSVAYYYAFVISSILLAGIGLMAAYWILIPKYGLKVSLIAVNGTALGLSLGYYILFEPTMAHAASFGCVTLYILVCIKWHGRLEDYLHSGHLQQLLITSAMMGFLLGVCSMVRFTNAVYAVIPLSMSVVTWHAHAKHRTPVWFRGCVLSVAVASVFALIGFCPQLIAWWKIYGSIFTFSYEGETISWIPLAAVSILFGKSNSLFLWTPLALPAVIGLWLGARKGSNLCIGGVIAFAVTVWVYAGWSSPSLGHSYGMRAFVDISFFFMLGIAELWLAIANRWKTPGRVLATTLLTGLVCWNIFFITCYRANIQPHGKPFAGAELFRHGDRWLDRFAKDSGIYALRNYLNDK